MASDPGTDLGLVPHSRQIFLGGLFGRGELDGYVDGQAFVTSPPDHPHSALAQWFDQAVAISNEGACLQRREPKCRQRVTTGFWPVSSWMTLGRSIGRSLPPQHRT